jgi:hypothetical protein
LTRKSDITMQEDSRAGRLKGLRSTAVWVGALCGCGLAFTISNLIATLGLGAIGVVALVVGIRCDRKLKAMGYDSLFDSKRNEE